MEAVPGVRAMGILVVGYVLARFVNRLGIAD
jgi:hypothetical protein